MSGLTWPPAMRAVGTKLGLHRSEEDADRLLWGSGPWDKEPWDYIHWGIYSAPYEGIVVRLNGSPQWTGFVVIHPDDKLCKEPVPPLPEHLAEKALPFHAGQGLPGQVNESGRTIGWWTFGFMFSGSPDYVNVMEAQRTVVEIAEYLQILKEGM